MKAPDSFNLANAFDANFIRKTVDYAVYIYLVVIVALWVGQTISPVTFRVFSSTSTLAYGASRDYCSPAQFYSIPNTTVAAIYNASYGPANISDVVGMVRWLMMTSAGLDASAPPYHIFSVPDRNYCLGPVHYAIAYNLNPPSLSYSKFWQYVRDNRETLYAAFDDAPHIRMLVFLYLLPLWIYIACRIAYELRMLLLYYRYESLSQGKFRPMFSYSLASVFLPVIINSVAVVLLAVKVAGAALVHNYDIFIVMALHILATLLQYAPFVVMKVRSRQRKILSASDAGATAEYSFGATKAAVSMNYRPPPPDARVMTFYYYSVAAVVTILIGLYVSQDLAGMAFSVFNPHCDGPSLDSCIDANGDALHNYNAHVILAMAAPILALMLWRLAWFMYFCSRVNSAGTVRSKSLCGNCADSVDIEIQASITAITEWRIKGIGTTQAAGGLRLTSESLILNSGSSTLTRVRLLIVGRFVIPLLTAVTAVVLAILKLSQYALWHGMPWWGIALMLAIAITVSIFMELVPLVGLRAKANAAPKASSSSA